MKNLLYPIFISACLATGFAQAQPYVNVTVGGQFSPGVYGQVSVSNAPPPVINPQPVIVGSVIQGAPVIYMHVPDYEQERWAHYCERYRACGRPVHFVRVEEDNRWWEGRGYEERRYEDQRRGENRHDNGEHRGWEHGNGHGHGHGRGRDKED